MATTHVHMILQDLEHQLDKTSLPLPILRDSKSAIAIGTSFKDTKHTRHILRRYHYVRDAFNTKRFTPHWISQEFQLADIGTKNLGGPRHNFLLQHCLIPIATDVQPLRSVQEG
jgi:hypothetical protein